MTLRLYTDASLVPAGTPHVAMLVPFLGRIDPPDSPMHDRFDRYMEIGRTLFAQSTLADADLAVLPFGWEQVLRNHALDDVAASFADRARAAGKRLVVFCDCDSAEPVPFADTLVFRTSLYGSRRRPGEFALPSWTGDWLAQHFGGQLPLRARGPRAIVGFRGYVPPWSRSRARDLVIGVQQAVGLDMGEPFSWHTRRLHAGARRASLDSLEASDEVEALVVRNQEFAGGSRRNDLSFDLARLARARAELAPHIASWDYGLCVRGCGNFSYRLYETLSCGRLPVFVDTDCVLPFDDLIDWREQCWVDIEDVAALGSIVARFHDGLSDDDFRALQHAARARWAEWLSPEGFFTNVIRLLG